MREETGDDPELLSKEALLTRYMNALGFTGRSPIDKKTLEFCKVLSDASGKIAKTTIVVGKDEVGLEPTEPLYATITMQIQVPMTDEALKTKAPTMVRTDLQRILAFFDEQPENRSEASVQTCSSCGARTADFELSLPGLVCADCAELERQTEDE